MRRQLKANAERDAFLYGTPLPRVVGEVHNPFSNIYSLYGGGNPFASSIGGAGGGSSGGAGGGGTSNVGSVLSMNGMYYRAYENADVPLNFKDGRFLSFGMLLEELTIVDGKGDWNTWRKNMNARFGESISWGGQQGNGGMDIMSRMWFWED